MVVDKNQNFRYRQYLIRVGLFENCTDAQIDRIILASEERKIQNESFLFFQGDPAIHVYLLVEGRIKLAQITPNGQQVILRYASPGDAIAIIALLSEMEYLVSAEATQDSLVLRWSKVSLDQLMEISPQISHNALKILAKQTREFQSRVRELSTERTEQRIARALLRLARQTGKKVDEGVMLAMPLSRQDLAEMTGSTLYTVSRTLSKWEGQGLVNAGRQRVTILYPHGLVVIAEDLPQAGNQDIAKAD